MPADAVHFALLEALLSCIVFLEESPDDIIDPDSAVAAMEHAAHPLLALPAAERAALVELMRQLAARQEPGPWRDFIQKQPRAFGLTES